MGFQHLVQQKGQREADARAGSRPAMQNAPAQGSMWLPRETLPQRDTQAPGTPGKMCPLGRVWGCLPLCYLQGNGLINTRKNVNSPSGECLVLTNTPGLAGRNAGPRLMPGLPAQSIGSQPARILEGWETCRVLFNSKRTLSPGSPPHLRGVSDLSVGPNRKPASGLPSRTCCVGLPTLQALTCADPADPRTP